METGSLDIHPPKPDDTEESASAAGRGPEAAASDQDVIDDVTQVDNESSDAPLRPAGVNLRLLPSLAPPGDGCHRIWRRSHKKCRDQTDEVKEWYSHKRHVLVFTYSGKPVYSRYGEEDGLSGTTGALSAIVSKMAKFFFCDSTTTDCLRYMTAGEHVFTFLERGPLWLVCISCSGDLYGDMVCLLERVHMQIITILTAGIERTLVSRPNYDMRGLLGGTEQVVNSMIRWCVQDMFLQCEGFEALPLAPSVRNAATEALKSARLPNVLFAFLMAGHRVLSAVSNRQYRLNALDLGMVINIIMSSASLRTGESWTPVCMSQYNDKGFAYAYISFLEGSDVGLVFLSTASDGEQFYAISQQAAMVKDALKQPGCAEGIEEAISKSPIDLASVSRGTLNAPAESSPGTRASIPRRSLLAPGNPQWQLLEGVIHAAYYVPALQQYFSSQIAEAYQSRRRVKMLFRNYGRCRQLLRNAKVPCQICVATDHECFYVSMAADYQLFLSVPRGISTGVIAQFYHWVRSQESHIFLQIPTW
ncbi:Vacuolar fusion protein MON1-like A [Symbiodinium microadriaticum]|uniref:Vacuolar fusion protein MON1-like A n=1 Tax=Symbiodinium microadriaticum TaxID=2951 RepID=A0A1Q9CE38_SYMMI|nr:Vacuolar fusion protein MON1-like A [Symbiodinium microadriaticum]CAE7946470.1 MON1 [Symbiodinium sp. KB8]